MSEHTATPWNVRDHTTGTSGRHIWVDGGPAIGETRAGPYKRQILEDDDYPEKRADADLIVKAVNSHDALVKALEAAPILSKYHGMRGFEAERFIVDYEAWRDIAREALAKAATS